VVGVALDVTGRQLEQLFYHTNACGFLLLHLESGECDISCLPLTTRASPATSRNREEHRIQPIGNQEAGRIYCEIDSDWLECKK
jgi:hypothetical protein